MPSTQFRTPIYSFAYARVAVESFVEKHARATIFLAGIYESDNKAFVRRLVMLFQYRNRAWNQYRDLIKWVDFDYRMDEIRGLPEENRLDYLKSVKSLVDDYDIFEKNSYSSVDNA